MTEKIVVFMCRECGFLGQPESVAHKDGSGGEHRCRSCGYVCGFWINGGTLDLSLVEPAHPEDFTVFDPPSA